MSFFIALLYFLVGIFTIVRFIVIYPPHVARLSSTIIVDHDPQYSSIYLMLMIFLWVLLIGAYLYYFIYSIYKTKRNLLVNSESGQLILGTILDKEVSQRDQIGDHTKLKVEFNNFSNSRVAFDDLEIIDSKPHEKRFEIGNPIELKATQNKDGYFLNVASKRVDYNKEVIGRILFIAFILLGTWMVMLWFMLSTYSNNQGFTFLHWTNPLIQFPFWLMVSFILLRMLLARFIKKHGQQNYAQMLFYGKRVPATILSSSRTGWMTNDDPEMKLRFKFQMNDVEEIVEIKQLIPLEKLHRIEANQQIDLLINPTDHSDIMIVYE